MIVSFGAGVLKHLPGQHDQSTHGSGAGSGSPKLTILGKNDGTNKFFNEKTRVVRFQPEGKEPKDYVLYADGADAVIAYEKPTDGTTIDGYSSFTPDKREVGHLEIARPGQGTAWRRSSENDKKATVIEAAVMRAHQRRGLASAMLRFHRDLYPELETVHSDALTDQGKAWSQVAKHLPGQHDQSSHGGGGKGAQGTTSELSDDEIRDVIYGSKTINEMYVKIAKRQGKSMKPSVALLSADEVTHYRGVQFVDRDAQRLLDGKIRRFEHATWGQGTYLASDKDIASNYGTLIGVKLDASAKMVQGETTWDSAFDVSYENPRSRTMTTTSSSFIDFDRLTARVGSGQMKDFSVSDLRNVYWAGKGYDGLIIHGETALFNGSKLTVNSADVGNAVQKHLPGQHDQSSHGRKGGGQASWQHYEDTYADNIAVSDVFVKEFGQGTLVVAFEDSDPEFGLDAEGQKRVMQWIEETQAVAPIVGEPFMPSAELMDAAVVNALMAGDARNVMVVVDDAGFDDVPSGALGYTAVTRHGAMRDTVIHIRQEFLVRAQNETIARAGLDPTNFMPTARTSLAGKYVITHEWGHAHDMNSEDTAAKQLRDVWDIDDGQGNAGGGLSSYGMSDPREAYAEAFTQHFLPPSTTSIASMMGSKRNVATEMYAEWNNWGTVAKGLAPKGTLTYPADMLTVVIYDTFKDAPIIRRDVPYGVHPTPVAKHGDPSRPNYASQHPNSRGGGFARNLTAIRSGRKVTVNPEDVEPMLELMSQGSDQPNLTLLSVKGMEGETFDTENLGLDRSQMPQVPSQLKAKFIADMEAQGVGMERSERNPIGLKPIQGEISGRSAGFIMQNEKKDRKVTDAARVLVTRDGWILDGHHRWAGSVALELAGHGHSLPVLILDQDLGFAMDTVRKWGEANGVQSLDLGERNKKSDLSKTLVTFAAGVLKHGDPSRPNYAALHPNSPHAIETHYVSENDGKTYPYSSPNSGDTLDALLLHSLAPNASDIPADEELRAKIAKDMVASDIEKGMSDVSTQDLASSCLGDQYRAWVDEQKIQNGFLLPPQDGDYTENNDGEFFDSDGKKFDPATPANLTVFFAEDGSLKPDAPEFTIEQDGSLMAVVPDLFEDSLSPRTPEGEKALRKTCVGRLVKNWAGTSNDSDSLSLAMQEAAKKEFGLDEAEEWTKTGWEPDKVAALVSKHGPVYQRFLRVQYNNTQKFFSDHNLTEVVAFRGRKSDTGSRKNAKLTMRPLSSWTYNKREAIQFASPSFDGEFWKGTLFTATIPVANILSLPTTGMGCLNEQELVLIGRPVIGRAQ
jgi:hypothetical protein